MHFNLNLTTVLILGIATGMGMLSELDQNTEKTNPKKKPIVISSYPNFNQENFIENIIKKKCTDPMDFTNNSTFDIRVSCAGGVSVTKRGHPFQPKIKIYQITGPLKNIVQVSCWEDSKIPCPYINLFAQVFNKAKTMEELSEEIKGLM